MAALRGGAELVHSVDSSAKAVALTDDNVAINFPDTDRHKAFAEDAFKFISNIEKDSYNLIILDPPAFAKHRDALKNALIGYRKLNARAMEKIAPGGLLFTFSCSQAVSREQFRLAVFSAATMARRRVRILHQLTQPADHPVNICHPEGEYLKRTNTLYRVIPNKYNHNAKIINLRWPDSAISHEHFILHNERARTIRLYSR